MSSRFVYFRCVRNENQHFIQANAVSIMNTTKQDVSNRNLLYDELFSRQICEPERSHQNREMRDAAGSHAAQEIDSSAVVNRRCDFSSIRQKRLCQPCGAIRQTNENYQHLNNLF